MLLTLWRLRRLEDQFGPIDVKPRGTISVWSCATWAARQAWRAPRAEGLCGRMALCSRTWCGVDLVHLAGASTDTIQVVTPVATCPFRL